jgi:hypothetical protein
MQTMTHAEWLAEATRRFGDDPMAWKFVCPKLWAHCQRAGLEGCRGARGSRGFFRASGATATTGRTQQTRRLSMEAGPCNYTGGGLFKLNPVAVNFGDGDEPRKTFAFADGPRMKINDPTSGD